MTYSVGPAGLKDWAEIEVLSERLRSSRFNEFVSGELSELEGFLINARVAPHAIGLLTLRVSGGYNGLVGLAALIIVDCPKPGVMGPGIQTHRHGFINSVYIDPLLPPDFARKTPAAAGEALLRGIEHWSRERGAVYLYGNVRLDGRFGGLWRKFGLSPQFGTVGKSIPSTQIEELPGLEMIHVVVGKELGNGQG